MTIVSVGWSHRSASLDLLDIRAAKFSGQCGVCTFGDLCGGSRARAWAASGDVLAEDPACLLVAEATSQVPVVDGSR